MLGQVFWVEKHILWIFFFHKLCHDFNLIDSKIITENVSSFSYCMDHLVKYPARNIYINLIY